MRGCFHLQLMGLTLLSVLSRTSSAKPLEVPPLLGVTPVESFRSEANYGPGEAILNAAFAPDSKLEFSFGGVYSPFSSLVKYYGVGASLTYHFNRRHALEPINFSYNQTSLSTFTQTQIADKLAAADRANFSVEAPHYTFIAGYVFSPYYSKMHITERTVTHFDLYLGLGAGFSKIETLVLDQSKLSSVSRPAFSFSTGMRFLFPSRWALRGELRDTLSSFENFGTKSLNHSLQISLAASIFFGAFPD